MLGSGAAFTEFSVHLDFAAPRRPGTRTGRCGSSPTSCCRAAIDDGSIRTDLDPDLLAAFLLSSVRTVTEITIAGTATAAARAASSSGSSSPTASPPDSARTR